MNDFAFLLFTTQKYSSFNPPYFPKRTLKFFLNSIPACSVTGIEKKIVLGADEYIERLEGKIRVLIIVH